MERRGEAGVEEGSRGDRSGDWNSSTTTRGGPRRVASSLDTATPIDPDPNSAPPSPHPHSSAPRSLTLHPADCRVAMETEQGF